MYRVIWLFVLSLLLLLTACSSNENVETELNIDRKGFTAYFDLTPGVNVIPFPNNLLYSGSLDGTLNIPVADVADFSDPKVAMNALDGFSTVAPMSTTFSSAIDAATLTPATVRVFEVTLDTFGGALPVGGPVTGITRELVFGVEFFATLSSVDPTNSTLVILPTAPLKPSSSYTVMLTDGIKSVDGTDPQTSAHYLIAKSGNPLVALVDGVLTSQHPAMDLPTATKFEQVRQLVNAQEYYLALEGVDTSSVILSWTLSTQSVGVVLNAARTAATGTAAINPTPVGTTADLLPPGASLGLANVYVGSLDVPYYLKNAFDSPLDPLQSFWQGVSGSNLTFLNPNPVPTSTETIPLLLSVPATGSAPWPVVIFQHGITSNRTSMLAAADSLASAGFAVVAIDLPLHGLKPPAIDDPPSLYSGFERTFDLDLVDNATGVPGPDGTADSSGTHYINLSSLLTTRDNGRQAVADLFSLKAALATMDYDGDIVPDFDTANIHFVGHSLGAMVGTGFIASEPDIKASVLGMPGGGVAKLLDGSASFGPRIAAGLAAKGVVKGTADFESFMGAFQTVVDSADPLNYAAAATIGREVMLFEVLGDLVVPNNVMADAPVGTVPSPLAGTDPLAFFMGLQKNTATTPDGTWLRFTAGDHSSILSPAASLTVTQVMQTAMASFLAYDGASFTILDDSVLE